jgi:GxxExxY protein
MPRLRAKQSEDVSCEVQKKIPIVYHNIRFEIGFRADLIVDNKLLIEVKAIDQTAASSPSVFSVVSCAVCRLNVRSTDYA